MDKYKLPEGLASDDLVEGSQGGFLIPPGLLRAHWADIPVQRKGKVSAFARWLGCQIAWFSRSFVMVGNWVFELGMTTERVHQKGLLDFFDETEWQITRPDKEARNETNKFS